MALGERMVLLKQEIMVIRARIHTTLEELADQEPAERLAGQQELYVKPLPRILSKLPILVGLTVLGNGEPVFLIDSHQLR